MLLLAIRAVCREGKVAIAAVSCEIQHMDVCLHHSPGATVTVNTLQRCCLFFVGIEELYNNPKRILFNLLTYFMQMKLITEDLSLLTN